MKTLTSIAIVALFIFSALIIHMPTGTEGAQSKKDAGGYQYTDGKDPEPTVECNYIDVSGNSKRVGLDTSQWGALQTVNLPFSFTYYGTSYAKLHVSTYGAMSFVDSNANNYESYWNHNSIPNSAFPRGLIAVYWTWASECQDSAKSRLVTLTTKVDEEDAFIVEWNPTQGGKFEAIFFKSGAIKFQYQSVPNTWGGGTGSYSTIGIEKPDDTAGVQYTTYQYYSTDLFPLPFAIMFHRDEISMTEGRLENGDGSDHSIIYPGSKDYIFSVEALHSTSWDSILSVILTLGPGNEGVRFAYWVGNDTFGQLSGGLYAELLPGLSKSEPNKDGFSGKVTFAVNVFLTYPTEDERNFTFFASGRSAVPMKFMPEHSYRIERGLKWSSNTVMCRLDSGVRVDNDGYVPGKARIWFYNLRVYYDKSQVQPRPGVVMVNITEQSGSLQREKIPQGKGLESDWITSDTSSVMIFTFIISEIEVPKVCILAEPIKFQVRVDTDQPDPVDALLAHPDSLDDGAIWEQGKSTFIDDDYRVYLSWNEGNDGLSGIGGYRIEATGPGYHRTRETAGLDYYLGNKVGDELPEGIIDVSVRAYDKVGNLGQRTSIKLIIDHTGPTYLLVDPLPGAWVKVTKPTIKVKVSDPLSGIDTFNLTYRASKDGGYTWGDRQNCDFNGWGDPERIVSLEPSLSEGRNNVVEIMGYDVAHSQETTAQFQILVDPRAPRIGLVDVPLEADGRTTSYLRDPSEPIRVSVHDYMGSGLDMSRLTFRYSTDNGTTFSADIPMDAEPFNNSQGFSEIQYNLQKDWVEGDGNLLIIDAGDNVGRNITMTFRIRIDVTPLITIYRPSYGATFLDNQTIRFDADVIDPDNTNGLSVSWISNIQGILGTGGSIMASLQAGEHIISLVVKDKAHTVTRTFTLLVKSYLLENPYLKDSDGDGMSDGFEDDHGPDPLVVGSKGLDKNRNDALEDLDGDSYSNLKEYQAGTDPLFAGSHPGSTLKKEDFPILSVIVMAAGIALVMIMGILTVLESRKTPNYGQAPRYPVGLPQYYQQALMPPQVPNLPPAPPFYRPPQ